MFKSKLYFLAIAFGTFACTQASDKVNELAPGEYSITVKVMNPQVDGTAQLVQIRESGREVIDSAAFNSKDSTFQFRGKLTENDFAIISLDGLQEALVFLEAGATQVQMDGVSKGAYKIINGTRSNEYIQQFNDYQTQYKETMDAFQQEYALTQDEVSEADMLILQEKFDKLQNSETERLKALIRTMDSSVVAIYSTGLFYDKDAVFGFLDSLSKRLSSQMPNERYVQLFTEEINKLRKFAIGEVAPDFALNDINGKSFKLSELRGSVVLVDFWASWCKPCRMENPNVVKTYNKFKKKPFRIVGVSLDRAEEPWKEAIKADGLIWNQVWDKEGAVAGQYAVNSIPATFLLDKEGRIIAKNLRGGALEAKLSEVL